jgi:hypothetical protein
MGTSPVERQQSLTPALAIWLTPQLLSLMLSALRVPLSAHPPRPMESLALEQMIIVQIVAAALLAPMLFRSIGVTIAVIVAAAPMFALAGVLATVSLEKTAALYQLGASWGLALGCICATLPRPEKLFASAIAATWSLGGLALAYLRAEFSPQRNLPDLVFGPACVALRAARNETLSPTFWFMVGTFTTLGLAGMYAARFRDRRASGP